MSRRLVGDLTSPRRAWCVPDGHGPDVDTGRVRGAALDVFAVEPLPPAHPLWRHPRVLVSPHVAAVTGRFWERETALIVANIRRYLAGAPLVNVVDPEAGD